MSRMVLIQVLLQKIPEGIRIALYVIALLATIYYGAVQSTNGDWVSAVPIFLGTLLAIVAGANVKQKQ